MCEYMDYMTKSTIIMGLKEIKI